MKLLRFLTLTLIIVLMKESSAQTYDTAKFILVKGNNASDTDFISLNATCTLLSHPNFTKEHKTLLYVFGYTEKYLDESVQTIVSAYILRGGYNILVLDWSDFDGGNYPDAIQNSFGIAKVVAGSLLAMRNSGFNLDLLHLVGHSLGGQMVGAIGRNVYNQTQKKYKLKRISALDPAGPLFYYPSPMPPILFTPISKSDALFVDIIHTDSRTFGAPNETGTVDFWPNNGHDQPMCPPAGTDITNLNNFCSHWRSWRLWAESVQSNNTAIFPAIYCRKISKLLSEFRGVSAYMGINADHRLVGNYYLSTNGAAPFNRGTSGLVWSDRKNCSISA